MKCITCLNEDVTALNLDACHGPVWCPRCGTLFSSLWRWPIRVPAQAKRYKAMREIVKEVVDGVRFCDPRMKYGEYQVGCSELEEMKKALALDGKETP